MNKTNISQAAVLLGVGVAVGLFIFISSCVMEKGRVDQERLALSLRAEAENAKVTKALEGADVSVFTELSDEDICVAKAKEEFGWTNTDKNDGFLRYEFSRGRIFVYNTGVLHIDLDTLKSLRDSAQGRWHDHHARSISLRHLGKYKESAYEDMIADVAYDQYSMFYHRIESRQ